jgi:hypothetical protein
MQVAFVISQDQGGLPHYAAELANAVSKSADVLVFKPTETTADDMFDDSVTLVEAFRPAELSLAHMRKEGVKPLTILRGLASYRSLRQVRDHDPDVIHFVTDLFPHVQFFGWLSRLGADSAIVATVHGVRPGSALEDTNLLNVATRVLSGVLPRCEPDHRPHRTEQADTD